jgi:two-component system, chemotaxis family, CheB/CheR fusion protein
LDRSDRRVAITDLIGVASSLRAVAAEKMRIEQLRLHGRKVLVVEDIRDIRDVFTLLLEAEGAEVVAATNGREAIECMEFGSFDAVVSDYGLPDIAGDELLRRLGECSGRLTKTVVVTGYGEPYVTRARRAGADVVLTKPVIWDRLLGSLTSPSA